MHTDMILWIFKTIPTHITFTKTHKTHPIYYIADTINIEKFVYINIYLTVLDAVLDGVQTVESERVNQLRYFCIW